MQQIGTQLEVVKNSTELMVRPETASDVLSAQAKALVNARYQVAMMKPRDWDDVRQKLLRDCERPRFAETAIYRKPMGNSSVQGLSVRFAESAIRTMGNLQPEHIVVYDDAKQRIVRISLTDIEANVSYSKDIVLQKTVERKTVKPGTEIISQRKNSSGETTYLIAATEDELLIKEAAHASKIMRQHALRILPADIQEECEDQIRATVAAKIKADPDAEKKKLIDGFGDLGIGVVELKKYLQIDSLDTLTPKDLADLRLVYQALRDGETNWREVMAQRAGTRGEEKSDGTRTQQIAEKLKAKPVAKADPTVTISPFFTERFDILGWDAEKRKNYMAIDSPEADKLAALDAEIDRANG
jgi:hypothetical protein